MKLNILYLISVLILLSCNSKVSDTTSLKSESPKSTENTPTQFIIDTLKINTEFPFGYPDLTKFEYPKFWKGDLENYGQLIKPDGEEFERIGKYFRKLHANPTIGKSPKVIKIEQITLRYDNNYLDTLASKAVDNVKFRLPNVGKFKCFYSFQQSEGRFGEYGNLLFIDSITQVGKTVNVYNQVSGDQSVEFRYFTFDGKTIKLYNGICYDDGCELTESNDVLIQNDGQIIVKEIKP